MFLCAIEERLDALDNLEPLDRQPPPELIELLGPLLAAALGLEAEEDLEADIPGLSDPGPPQQPGKPAA